MEKSVFLAVFLFLLTESLFSANPQALCDFAVARELALKQANSVEVELDSAIVPYRENLRQKDGLLITRNLRGYRRIEIPLWFLDMNTCRVISVKIERRIEGGRPVLRNLTDGITIDIEEGPYGKIWNGYNTAYFSPDNPSFVPLLNVWLPARRDAEKIYYSSHSLKLRQFFPALAKCGLEHYRSDLSAALEDLRRQKALSHAFSNMLLADVAKRWFDNVLPYLPFIEQSDHRWFEEFVETGVEELNPYRRVAEIICANGDLAYESTRSSVGALGLMQIWPATCENLIRKNYPQAEIPKGCGSVDESPYHGHIEAIKAAIVHLDSTLNEFMKAERGTGFFGFITRHFMNAVAEENDFFFHRDLSRSRARGEDVRRLQRRLSITADGIFGPQTGAAVVQYQRQHFEKMFSALEGDLAFLADLGDRQIAAYNSNVVRRVIPAKIRYLDRWDQLNRIGRRINGLMPQTIIYLRIYRHIRDNPEVIYR